MTSIKIIYGDTARRFNVSDNTEWEEIANRLSTLFLLKPSTAVVLSYVDSDEDTITLNSTAELREAISQGITKFKASIKGSEPSSDDWVIPGGVETPRTIESAFEALQVQDNSTAETVPIYSEVAEIPIESSQYQTIVEDAEELPEYRESGEIPVKIEKGKQKEEVIAESSRAGAERARRSNEDGEAFPFQQIQEQLQKLCEQFKDVIEQNPQLLETANNLMGLLAEEIPVDIDVFASFLHNTRDSEAGPFPFVFRPGPFGPFGRRPFHAGFPHPFFGPGSHPFASRGGFRGGCPAYRRAEGCGQWRQCQEKKGPSNDEEAYKRYENCRAKKEERLAALRAAELKAKVEALNSMGFYETFSDESFEELLGRYEGNVERVVDVLIQRQQGQAVERDEKARGYDI